MYRPPLPAYAHSLCSSLCRKPLLIHVYPRGGVNADPDLSVAELVRPADALRAPIRFESLLLLKQIATELATDLYPGEFIIGAHQGAQRI